MSISRENDPHFMKDAGILKLFIHQMIDHEK